MGFMIPTAHKSFAERAQDGIYWRHRPVIQFSATPSPAGQAYEDLGEHTDAILREQGYSFEDLDRLEAEGVIRRGPRSRDGSSE
jgi:crotonobetainyl-CoA:carnitine CoA-transferase CaiB-like acyl-CoA transferase